jgi:hypothetical protein
MDPPAAALRNLATEVTENTEKKKTEKKRGAGPALPSLLLSDFFLCVLCDLCG